MESTGVCEETVKAWAQFREVTVNQNHPPVNVNSHLAMSDRVEAFTAAPMT